MKIVFFILLTVHALIHLLGTVKAFQWAEIPQFTQQIAKPMGLLWLLATILFLATAILYLLKKDAWSLLAIAAVLVSQVLIVMMWSDAKFGTIANLIILIVAAIAIFNNNFEYRYKTDVRNTLEQTNFESEIITEKDLIHLPEPVKRYLQYVGVIGMPKPVNFKILMRGEMRNKEKSWFSFSSEQYNFIENPARHFFMKAKIKGLPTFGYHRYWRETALMDIKLASIISVSKIQTEVLFTAETVTFFNDLCLFCPGCLTNKNIRWEKVDATSVRAFFTNKQITISAVLKFNENNQLINFISDDRLDVSVGKKYRFSTPVSNYKNINGYMLPTFGEAIWHYPQGKFTYGKFTIENVEYNIPKIQK
ncbi:MAG: hypothetical protein CMC07_10675 [Flavobacteriaceae bacterium]|nr:hypothetical protein [Flavobacteriaceae bacterium]|tara:strand:+ start:58924 stop:60015 length:1092 start_codon:yes stop_codon:yes gene_type:complete